MIDCVGIVVNDCVCIVVILACLCGRWLVSNSLCIKAYGCLQVLHDGVDNGW